MLKDKGQDKMSIINESDNYQVEYIQDKQKKCDDRLKMPPNVDKTAKRQNMTEILDEVITAHSILGE